MGFKGVHQTHPFDLPLFTLSLSIWPPTKNTQMYFQRYIVSPSPRYILPSDPCFSRPSDRWEIYGRSPLHPDWEERRGWRTPRNFARSPRPKISNLFFSSERPVSECETEFLSFSFSENIFDQVETAFGKLVEERFEYLIVHGLSFFRWQRALGLSGDLPRPTKLDSPCLYYGCFEFPLNLPRFCQGPFDLNILSCS